MVAADRLVGAILLGPGNDVAGIRSAITQGREVDVAALRDDAAAKLVSV
mgnify:CR=1 FL=1